MLYIISNSSERKYMWNKKRYSLSEGGICLKGGRCPERGSLSGGFSIQRGYLSGGGLCLEGGLCPLWT